MSIFDANMEDAKTSEYNDIIPPGSKVYCNFNINFPDRNICPDDECLKYNDKGNIYLSFKLTVMRGRYIGNVIYGCLFLKSNFESTQKRDRSTLRSIIESVQKIPSKCDDNDPNKAEYDSKRRVEISSLNDKTIIAQLGCGLNSNGYVNNTLVRAISVDDKDYKKLEIEGELITDKPIPTAEELRLRKEKFKEKLNKSNNSKTNSTATNTVNFNGRGIQSPNWLNQNQENGQAQPQYQQQMPQQQQYQQQNPAQQQYKQQNTPPIDTVPF